jgi:ribosome-associated protein
MEDTSAKQPQTDKNEALVQSLGAYLRDIKAKDVVVLDVRNQCSWSDWFVLATYNSQGHLRGLIDELDVWAVTQDVRLGRPKKKQVNEWMLIDWGNIVIHLFSEKARAYYELEKLWFNAPASAYTLSS